MTYSKQLIEKRDAELAKADALVAIAADEKRELSQEEDTQIAQTLEVVRDLDEQITRQRLLTLRRVRMVINHRGCSRMYEGGFGSVRHVRSYSSFIASFTVTLP